MGEDISCVIKRRMIGSALVVMGVHGIHRHIREGGAHLGVLLGVEPIKGRTCISFGESEIFYANYVA